MDKQFVYSFNEGSKDMRSLLGGKGANLAEMTKIGLPVPFGFTVTTEACKQYYKDGKKIDESIIEEILQKLEDLENVMGKKLGDPSDPLLVSVRSGAPISMPGMMDTVLNLGLNDETVEALGRLTENDRFAYDSYRRFLQMFGDVVMEVPMKRFNEIFDGRKAEVGAKFDVDLTTEDLKEIIKGYKALYVEVLGHEFPQDPKEQLLEAVQAVFRSWGNDRAVLYRKLNDISENLGTAVNVQSMVFGNKGSDSGTGVAFTRNPATGENKLYGEFLINAQGEDVVAGIRTPKKISEMQEAFPKAYAQFENIAELLEKHYKDMQDMEFTVENGKLYMLQTRNGKRTAEAAVNIAVDMVNEGLIDKKTAILRIEPDFVEHLLHPRFDAEEESAATPIAHGLNASPGAGCGKICFSAEQAAEVAANGEKAVLVREETSPEDLAGMVVAEGILTAHGGATSHAAVVARGMGKCCVTGCSILKIDEEARTMEVGGKVYTDQDYISIDGTTGDVYAGILKLVPPDISGNFKNIMKWADDIRTLKVRTNADTPRDAEMAIRFGAEGIGLCRTEHMFFDEERIPAIREMIVADTYEERCVALAKLLPFQKADFKAMFKVMGDRPMTVRLLDPPLHEFLPKTQEDMEELSRQSGKSIDELTEEANDLKEVNPMLGHRGCRLAVSYPEIAEMQTEAIISAALEVVEETGQEIIPEIMVPLVGTRRELDYVKKTIDDTAERCFEKAGRRLDYLVGTMIEIPRAAMRADDIAETAEFFSFGTNDLTQMTFGFSRDDTAELIQDYIEKGIFLSDPFKTLDPVGVGYLVRTAIDLGKKARPSLHLGICGEHGGDPKSIELCNEMGLDYVSCSPYRVPVARLAATQAAIKQEK